MSEVMAEIGSEVRRFLDSENLEVFRMMYRTAIIPVDNFEIEIEQSKILSHEEAGQMQAGEQHFTDSAWFSDVEWQQHPGEHTYSRLGLQLGATYPLDYFEEKPTAGSFKGGKWLDQYGSISGFGSHDKVNVWIPEFVATGSRAVTRLRYPDDPTAMEQYNARFKEYLETLSEANPTFAYYRGWDRIYSKDARPHQVLGGMALAGFSAYDVVQEGSSSKEDLANTLRLLLRYEPQEGEFVGREITIVDDQEATTAEYWDGEDEPASDELLSTVLELVRHTTAA